MKHVFGGPISFVETQALQYQEEKSTCDPLGLCMFASKSVLKKERLRVAPSS